MQIKITCYVTYDDVITSRLKHPPACNHGTVAIETLVDCSYDVVGHRVSFPVLVFPVLLNLELLNHLEFNQSPCNGFLVRSLIG